jgi:serine/threonine-protein kinase
LSGQTLDDFHLLRRLGQGGMGQVYLAEQRSLKRRVALKLLKADLAANPTSLQRFKAEAEAVARATHANIVQVYAIGEAAGVHYMALEYVEGRNLRDYLAKKGPPEITLALSIMRQVAAALQRAGELGLIHRDIKPENILLTRKGEVKVADFGLSRCFADTAPPLHLTQTGVTMGTPLYMSPEQIEGRPLDPRTDIYSFGVTCYHMLAGQPPYRGESAYQVAVQHVQARPVPLQEVRRDLPAELCALVHKMMAKEPDQRYQTCRELLKDLNRLRDVHAAIKPPPIQGPPAAPVAAAPPEPVSASAPRSPGRMTAAVALTLALALATGALLAWLNRPSREPSPALPGVELADDVVEALFSQQAREQFLRQAVQQYANPGSDRTRLELGLRHCLELGLLYLEQRRLDKADRFFTGLMDNPHNIRAYRTLGRVGHAIVLAFQDQPGESNRLFVQLASDKMPEADRFEKVRFLFNNANLRYMIARALEHNAANQQARGEPFPAELEYLRKPPSPSILPGGPRRAPGERGAHAPRARVDLARYCPRLSDFSRASADMPALSTTMFPSVLILMAPRRSTTGASSFWLPARMVTSPLACSNPSLSSCARSFAPSAFFAVMVTCA